MSTDLIKAVAPVASSTLEGRPSVESRENEEQGTQQVDTTQRVQQEEVEKSSKPEAAKANGPPDRPSSEEVTERIKKHLSEAQSRGYLRELRFHYESLEDGVFQLKVMDAKTDKVLRTIPHEEQIEFAERLDNFLGLLIDEQA